MCDIYFMCNTNSSLSFPLGVRIPPNTLRIKVCMTWPLH